MSINEYEVAKITLQRQLQKYTRQNNPNQDLIYQAVIDTFLATLGNKFEYSATVEILSDAMTGCPSATFQLNRAKILVRDD